MYLKKRSCFSMYFVCIFRLRRFELFFYFKNTYKKHTKDMFSKNIFWAKFMGSKNTYKIHIKYMGNIYFSCNCVCVWQKES